MGKNGGWRAATCWGRSCTIEQDLGITTEQLPETVLRFVLSHPAVSTVIVGMRTVRNVERNVSLADGQGLPRDQVQALHRHRWNRNGHAEAGAD